ncbi:metallophosphoesterase [Psychrobacter sp. DAB_AL43B]|uniref:metallophosphoesterase n=1 Tax=Psychrobacter sp. DAB_AL43B TaxID=1028416 RepID=UPI0009A5D142|nr:metallophosphoesterase [Psychrobacter sp. DAB_AL43B]SLJ85973.1 metallophosphoesterase [Psychrobacter sp. DAB_AL43B]
MWLFILITQLLAIMSSIVFYWLIQPKQSFGKVLLVLSAFLINNLFLIYGLSEFWHERFHVYLVVSILQGFMFYAALITAVIAVVHSQIFKKQPRPIIIRAFAVVVYISIVSLAVFNAYSPVVHRLTVTTDKVLDKPMEIALVSDTHLGRWFGNRQIKKMISLINAQNPDVVVIAGDIMNDTTIAYDNTNMHEQLSELKAPLGVYATLGNHDYFGYDKQITQAVEEAGIKALDNESVLLNDSVWLVGRSDDIDRTRLSADELLTQVETDKPVIFLEHRPSAMDEISVLPVDLHLSGHTHGGQIFPLTILMDWFTPLNYGTKEIADTQFLVTSGYGIGAVPFRLGTRSEIWMITLQSAP